MKEVIALAVVAALLSGGLFLRGILTETVLLGQVSQNQQMVLAKAG